MNGFKTIIYNYIYIINGLFKCLINKLLYLIKMLFNNFLVHTNSKEKITQHYYWNTIIVKKF